MEDSGGAPARPLASGGQCAYTDGRASFHVHVIGAKQFLPVICPSFRMYSVCTDSGNKDVCGKAKLGSAE